MNFNAFSRPEVRAYLHSKIHEDINKILLSKSPFADISIQELAQQVQGLKIANKKFPFLIQDGIFFPPHVNLEQSSSEATAKYKATLFSGENFLDLTCGFAVDSFWIRKNFKKVTLVEQNERLLSIVKHNWQVLSVQDVTFLNQDLHSFLSHNKEHYSLIYLDPARRDHRDKRKFLLEDLSPDILEIEDRLYEFTDQLGIKLSPWFDLSRLWQQLKFVAEVHIVAVKNDVKELVVICRKGFAGQPSIVAVNLETEEPPFTTTFEEIKNAATEYAEPKKFLYIPNNSLLKTGAFNLIGERFHLMKLHPNTHLYTSTIRIDNFPGRVLEVETIRAREIPVNAQYNIISKNHPLKPDEIGKKYKIRDGGEAYLIFTRDLKGKVILRTV